MQYPPVPCGTPESRSVSKRGVNLAANYQPDEEYVCTGYVLGVVLFHVM